MATPENKFRETLWFKLGEKDAEAAQDVDAADAKAPTANMLPIEDRYRDDGSLAPSDTASFGVHTGKTEHLPPIRIEPVALDAAAMISDLKRGRIRVLAAIGASIVIVAGLAIYMM